MVVVTPQSQPILKRQRGVGLIPAALLLLSLISEGRSARAQADDSPWPVLHDGRVLMDVLGYHVAFRPDLRQGDVTFVGPWSTARVRPGEQLPLARVVAEPGLAREAFASSSFVSIRLVNSHNFRDRFLGRFERLEVPNTNVFIVTLHADRSAIACGEHFRPGVPNDSTTIRFCHDAERLAAMPPGPLDAYGFVVFRPDYLRGIATTYFVMPAAERLSVTGEPRFIGCLNWSSMCQNSLSHFGRGEFIRPGVQVTYQFPGPLPARRPDGGWPPLSEWPPAQSAWRDADARFRAVVDDFLQGDDGLMHR